MEIKITSQNEQLVLKKIEGLSDRISAACARALARGLLGAVAMAQRSYLSGPRPGRIQSITGRLRMGMNSSVTIANGTVTGQLGNNVKYAAFHEFGFHGVVNVKAHSRAVDQTFGNYVDSVAGTRRKAVTLAGEFLGYTESRKCATGRQRTGHVGVQFVKSHSRRVNYAGKPFVRPALDEAVPMILDELNQELAALK